MDYKGEHLWPGQLGHFFIVLSLVASLVASVAYFLSAKSKQPTESAQWKKLARYAFITEVISVFSIFALLLYIISNHLFEYKYAWQHSSLALEFKYLLACLWEGQEGSFLLWSIWHCVLGLVLIKTSKEWEAPVMTVVSFAQFALATMLVGIFIFEKKIGSNPFILLRESGDLDRIPFLHVRSDLALPVRADYLNLDYIKNGNDLNPLLQNRWMVIHPPVLFLGFASTIVPFAFAIAGLWTKKFGDWVRHALPWALFSAAFLGVGIMMGAWWAYESLTFGGYWAWDPVENASLVPWLILIAGIHTALIYKHSGHSLRSTHLFFILTFGFILYSTFLTRSGILGDTSVHAFTDLGMNAQLYLLLFTFIWGGALLASKTREQKIITGSIAFLILATIWIPSGIVVGLIALLSGLGILIYHIQTQVPTIHKEESGSSREFWMFIGSLVFVLSAVLIIGKTSLPVLNKVLESFENWFPSISLFRRRIAQPEDAEFAYNSIQVYVAMVIALLTAVTQYLRYKDTPTSFFWKKILIPTIIAGVISAIVLALGDVNYTKQGPMFQGAIWLAVACSIYAIIANASYIWIGLKGKLALSGGSISHFGFGIVLLGILLSSSKKEVLSTNTSGIFVPFGEGSKEMPGENLTLVKGERTSMGKYWVTYLGDSAHPKKPLWYYRLHFVRKDGKEDFILQPNAFINYKGNEGLMANPDSRHYPNHDVFTYITSLLPDPTKKREDTANFQPKSLKVGDSLFYSKGFMMLEKVVSKDSIPRELFGDDGKLYEASLKIYSKTGSQFTIKPTLAIAKGNYVSIPDTLMAESLVLQLQNVNADHSIELGVKESDAILEYVTLKAYKFPMINLLWAGVGITALGILMSMIQRIRQNRRISGKPVS